ncbi:uncharacterized protein LOC114350155 isoform X1 [Ostrinia furnacalis]|uniref:uncharacterized protein LOC114350155 isoform X1 n=1 Tax=Ostrinia furnacalis TaxID=93504 RepID=UPI00103F58EE|nr:uncharacterized protein LOC114350155 isoform X1 [Ostrinia furnacalis]
MCSLLFLVIYIVATEFASAASIYDQSQTGDINVQIDLKDLQIIALTKSTKEEYVDYDYAYDYSEMTIKPQNGTTQKPLNVTSSTGADVLKDNTTISTTVYADTTTESMKNSTLETVSSVEVTNITAFTTEKNVQTTTSNTTINKIDIITAANATAGCTRGYVRCDSQQPQQSKPLSILEMLSQKFKRRENRKNVDKKE